MKLSDKILMLRKQKGLSQEELAEKLNVSRQAISRWEVGSALPDASNILQLSRLFGVTADYLLNDDYESDRDIPAVKKTEKAANRRLKNMIAVSVSLFGLSGNFIFYILSRFIEVMVPRIEYIDGEKWYNWGNLYGISYPYFIRQYDLEFLTVLFWGMFLAGLIYLVGNSDKVRRIVAGRREKILAAKKRKESGQKAEGQQTKET